MTRSAPPPASELMTNRTAASRVRDAGPPRERMAKRVHARPEMIAELAHVDLHSGDRQASGGKRRDRKRALEVDEDRLAARCFQDDVSELHILEHEAGSMDCVESRGHAHRSADRTGPAARFRGRCGFAPCRSSRGVGALRSRSRMSAPASASSSRTTSPGTNVIVIEPFPSRRSSACGTGQSRASRCSNASSSCTNRAALRNSFRTPSRPFRSTRSTGTAASGDELVAAIVGHARDFAEARSDAAVLVEIGNDQLAIRAAEAGRCAGQSRDPAPSTSIPTPCAEARQAGPGGASIAARSASSTGSSDRSAGRFQQVSIGWRRVGGRASQPVSWLQAGRPGNLHRPHCRRNNNRACSSPKSPPSSGRTSPARRR